MSREQAPDGVRRNIRTQVGARDSPRPEAEEQRCRESKPRMGPRRNIRTQVGARDRAAEYNTKVEMYRITPYIRGVLF